MTGAPLLFCGHAADRTGPPIYLLHFLRWLRRHRPDVEFEVALLAGGDLEPAYRDLAPVSVYDGLAPTPCDDLERTLLLERLDLADRWWAGRRQHQIWRQMRQHAGARVVYVSSASAAELARFLPPGDRVVLSHVHDLEVGLTHRLGPDDRRLLLHDAQQVFVVAHAVGRNLVERHGVHPGVIAHHTEMIDADGAGGPLPGPARAEARRRKGLPVDGLVVGSCGTVEWRKGTDLFLRLAALLARRPRAEPLTFVWVGGDPAAIDRATTEAEILGVGDVVRFVGVQPDPVDWFRLMDVFVLPSREDPFPLVCLEAAAAGCPVVAFDNGGIPELLVKGCGSVAPYPDLHLLADRVDELLGDAALRHSMGERGRELVRSDHDVSVLAPRLWDDIERWLP